MSKLDIYYTLKSSCTAELKVKGSKFLADIIPIASEMEYRMHLENVKNKHSKAVHHCWAYKWGVPPHVAKCSDDGEPSGTAGKPMMGQLDAAQLTNIVAVVTRYFGGTLLGTSGLRKAYKEVVRAAVQNAELIEVKKAYLITIQFDIFQLPQVMDAAKRFPGEILGKSTDFSPYVKLLTEVEDLEYQLGVLKSNILNLPLDHAISIENPGFNITIESWL